MRIVFIPTADRNDALPRVCPKEKHTTHQKMNSQFQTIVCIASLVFLFPLICLGKTISLDEHAAIEGEWGYRPTADVEVKINPPGFCWRPQKGIVTWELECRKGADSSEVEYKADKITLNVHCPSRVFQPGRYTWRYRGVDSKGRKTNWSKSRSFTVSKDCVEMPLPTRPEILARIPKTHPRLFLRPEDLPRLRQFAAGSSKEQYKKLVTTCERLLKNPPPTKEPPKYPKGTVSHSEVWRKIWWGNRTYTVRALDGAATLAFTRLLGGKEEYGRLAKQILLDCAKWDPHGATGYRYNDEAGMPYNYHFCRTYTFVYDLLTEKERQICRQVMKIRGEEMYRHLYPRHLWQPYSSHSNRAWHFLGEIGIAFHGEIEEADDWLWFSMNVFRNVYPVWSDDDGGWHEGTSYWSSYVGRFTWWADIMRSVTGINAFEKPYFSKVGYYPIYLMPPGKVGGGFGDLTAKRTAAKNVPLVNELAAQANNGYWKDYVNRIGGAKPMAGYVGFLRGTLPKVEPKSLTDLPTSRLFRGTGQAYLNTTLENANNDVQVVFKSSPMGTYSHGYEANNSFLLWAYGQRLLIRSGYRDIYGSEHHKRWMWSTRSVNNITVEGNGQMPLRSRSAKGKIVAFETSPSIDVVVGEAATPYWVADKKAPNGKRQLLDRYSRAIVFVKPDLIIVFDRLVARQTSKFEYWLHAVNKFQVADQANIDLTVKKVGCTVSFLAPKALKFAQTDQYDPNPRPRIKLREWHLTATTPKKAKRVEFVTVLRPYRLSEGKPGVATLKKLDGGYVLTADVGKQQVVVLLPIDDEATLKAEGLRTTGQIVVERRAADGTCLESVTATRDN